MKRDVLVIKTICRFRKKFVLLMNHLIKFGVNRQVRHLTHRVAVVGSGPSGFYTITELFKKQSKLGIDLEITLFDKYPTPFGLSRYGVAPDHLEVKNCEETFSEIVELNKDKFNFVGNVKIGEDLKINELQENFNSVILSYGNTKENKLGLKNEEYLINSKKFVGWYNSEPNILESFTPPDLSKVENVLVIGNGNVSMDIVRMLLMPSKELANSDINDNALKDISKNTIKNIDIIARRSILESKFTTKEIRELFELEEHGVRFNGIEPSDNIELIESSYKKMERVLKRKYETILKFLKPLNERKTKYPAPQEYTKSWSLKYLKTPYEIKVEENKLKSMIFQKNVIEDGKIKPIDEFEEIQADLIITSLGFKGESIEPTFNMKFANGILNNKNFKVLDNSNEIIKGLYTTGWISNNLKGPILNTLVGSTELSEVMIEDINNHEHVEKKGIEGITFHKDITNWDDWLKLNEFELEFGKLNKKTRWKVPTVGLMIEIIKSVSVQESILKYGQEIKNYK